MKLHLILAACLVTAPVSANAAPQLRTKLEKLASRGNAEASYHLGMMYHLGAEGAARNPSKAFSLFKRAAAGGDPLGAYKLGCYYDGQAEGVVKSDAALAFRYKLIAAEAGYSLAQVDVGRHYKATGDTQRMLHWLEAAARQKNQEAVTALAAIYGKEASPLADKAKAYAYTLLLFGWDGAIEAEAKRLFQAEFSPEDVAAGEKILASWRYEPTPLTLKAFSESAAAEALVKPL